MKMNKTQMYVGSGSSHANELKWEKLKLEIKIKTKIKIKIKNSALKEQSINSTSRLWRN